MTEPIPDRRWRLTLPIGVAVIPIMYVFSSGPVLAIAFRLRELTGWDGFYAAMWLYQSLILFGPHSPFAYYTWWWCDLLEATSPG